MGKPIKLDSDESMKIKMDMKPLRARIVDKMTDALLKFDFANINFTRKIEFINLMTDIIVEQSLVDIDLGNVELRLTYLYEVGTIVTSFRNIFQSELKKRKRQIYGIYVATKDKTAIRDQLVSIFQSIFTDCIKFLLPNKKSISQSLNTKAIILEKLGRSLPNVDVSEFSHSS